MVFPLVLYYKEHSDQPTEKATVIFVSDDLQHDHQQVWRMEQRAVKILEEKTYLKFTRIIRFSDGCGAQFKSRFAVADLVFTSERLLGKIGNELYPYGTTLSQMREKVSLPLLVHTSKYELNV